jgi:Lrp/AsnC family transcriptional regulator, regulator for asnA, asnC and gidA
MDKSSKVDDTDLAIIDLGLLKITAAADPLTLGISVSAMVAIKAEGAMLREAAVEIAKFPEVGYVAICTGPYDILIEVACRDNDHLLDFISDKLAEVEGVREIETFLYLRIVKNTDLW